MAKEFYRPRQIGWDASLSFSVNLKVLPQGNLRGMSLQGPRSATTGRFTNTTLSSVTVSLLVALHSLITAVGILQHIIGCIHVTLTHS
jgi:hypothetical protein